MTESNIELVGGELTEAEKTPVAAAQYLQELRPKVEAGELMPLEVFLGVLGVTPAMSIECVMLRSNSPTNNKEVLLTPREEDDPVWPGQPHIPGTVLRVSDLKEGTLEPAFDRVFNDEVPGIKPVCRPKFINLNIGYNGRSFGIGLIYLINVTGVTNKGEFCSIDKMPDDLVESQRNFVKIAMQAD